METRTVQEAIHSAGPNVGHSRVFGCKAFVHVPAQIQDEKLSARAKEDVLARYREGDVHQISLSDDKTVLKTKHEHFDKNSERKVTKEKPKSLEFDTFDNNIVFKSLLKPHNSHETSIHYESFDFTSEERIAEAKNERSTALFEGVPMDSSLESLHLLSEHL